MGATGHKSAWRHLCAKTCIASACLNIKTLLTTAENHCMHTLCTNQPILWFLNSLITCLWRKQIKNILEGDCSPFTKRNTNLSDWIPTKVFLRDHCLPLLVQFFASSKGKSNKKRTSFYQHYLIVYRNAVT